MKIAIVGPSPVPYVYGGTEGLLWKLAESISSCTTHQVELIKLPIEELSFWDLIDSYRQFYKLDLSHFDMIISTKYPAWMVRHKNHIVYLQHHLRGLFDTYHFCNEPLVISQSLRVGLINDIVGIIQNNKTSEKNVDILFEKLDQLKKEKNNYDGNTFKFPGPFIRDIIHFFDTYALSKERIKRYFAISDNVKNRIDYFPKDVKIDVMHHPSKITNFQCGDYNYIFTVSRLDSPKRIGILIESMKYVRHNVKFKIAGIGPEEKKLKELANKDDRIEFIGFANEDDLINLYSNALVVLYIPYDEDYGLITIEAMMSKKPVITATDSGGSLEFVNNSNTGYVTEPDPQKLAEKINYFIENSEDARRMGYIAYQNVKNVTWDNIVCKLLNENNIKTIQKKKTLVLSTFSCYPPRGGGQHRLYNIYTLLARNFDVTICSIIAVNKDYQNLILENGLRQICIPQSKEHADLQWRSEKKIGVDLYDIAMIDLIEKSKDYVQKARELINDSDIIIFSHPYLYELRKFVGDDKLVIYESHNTECILKKDYIKNAEYTKKIKYIEQEACSKSDIIFATSDEDKNNLAELYNVDPKKITISPNGVDTFGINFIDKNEKTRQKEMVGISDYHTILFIGSWHHPNLEALKFIIDNISKKLKKYKFLIVGSIKDYYIKTYGNLPENILAFGTVDEDEKYELYKIADIAINPMFSGSGTNMKMLDCMSAGIPIISTAVGTRGLEIENYKHVIVCPPDQILEKIDELINNEDLKESLIRNARKLVEEKYSWEMISRAFENKLKERI